MKFSGEIGFLISTNKESNPGVYKPVIEKKKYVGDVLRNNRTNQSSEYQNDNIKLNSKLSIVANMYFIKNYQNIQYVVWNGVMWKVSSVDISTYPKVYIELGGVYNGRS